MFDWIKNINKNYPDFWKDYLSSFEEKSKRYVSLCLENTGLNPQKDKILSIGAVGIINNNIIVKDSFEITINELISEKEAIEKLIKYIGNSTLVGHRIYFDVEIINEVLEKMECGSLKNEALDIEIMYKKLHDINDKTLSLNELLQAYKIQKSDRISMPDDAFSNGLMFLKLKSKLKLK